MTLEEVRNVYKEVFYLEEDFILDIILAQAIATMLPGDPIWIMIVGSSSSGKSELCNTLGKVPFCKQVSTLTENTFLSNMKSSGEKPNSLLHEIGENGMIIMKDYTSILSMRHDKREIIIGQMREIYDGHLTKLAGNGNNQEWHGRINLLAAVTEMVYLAEADSAGMGRRTINFIMPKQDRVATTRRALANNRDITEKRTRIQDAFAAFVEERMQNLPSELPELPKDLNEELIEVADFITVARTPVNRNFKGEVVLALEAEMPMRPFQMLQTIGRILNWLYNEEGGSKTLKMERLRKILMRLAIDSIPKQVMIPLSAMTKYKMVTAKGVAMQERYPTETIRSWLETVNVIGLCERTIADSGIGTDIWVLNDDVRDMMIKYAHIKPTEDVLHATSEVINTGTIQPAWALDKINREYTSAQNTAGVSGTSDIPDDPGQLKEINKNNNEKFESLF